MSLALASLRSCIVSSEILSLGIGVSAALISNQSLCMFQLDTAETRVEWLAVAPNYANLFMDRFETKALEKWHLKPLLWLRFINDIFMIWTHGRDELNKFINYLNSIHPKIKFTSEINDTQG